jgi:alpha-galactosidase
MKNKIKFTIIGAGSISFAPAALADILLSEKFASLENLEIYLMDIQQAPLDLCRAYCNEAAAALGRNPVIDASTDLQAAVYGADFIITAIEVRRTHYWSQDFHIPRRYGFRQIFGENGGPGGMFHFLRNAGPMVEIARAVEKGGAPDAWLLNYSNPEAKLIDAVSKLTRVNAVGLCHGEQMGVDQISSILQIPKDDLDTEAGGLNHFGWFTKSRRKTTGEDLYPLLREKEKEIHWLAHWDDFALSRLMFRTYGLWPHPGANHIGEYVAWGEDLLASAKIQYFYDPAETDPWATGNTPEFIYSFSSNPTSRPFYPAAKPAGNDAAGGGPAGDGAAGNGKRSGDGDPAYKNAFSLEGRKPARSKEYGVPIAEAIAFGVPAEIGAVNVLNRGYIPNVPDNIAVEVPAVADGTGVHPKTISPLPAAVAAMVSLQGTIHQLLIDAYREKSRNKLLQALLLDPTVSSYNNAVALINEMCERQSEILPPMYW